MRVATLTMVATAAIALSGCANESRIGRNAAIGGAGGAAVGALVGGISPVEGAAIGAAGGAVIGAIQDDRRKDGDRRWYRDDRGNSYWVDSDGKRHYRD